MYGYYPPHKIIKYRQIRFIFIVFFLCIPLMLLLTACNHKLSDPYITKTSFLLNTVITINIYDKQKETLLEDCFTLIRKYEKIYSRTDPASELYALNQGTLPHEGLTYEVSDEMSSLLKYGLYYSKLTGGAFDISIAPITSLWDFTADKPHLPSKQVITDALPYVNYEFIKLNKNKVSFSKKGIGIDFGAIAKGFIADKVKEFLLKNGVKSAIINLGGNILCVGHKPDGTPFHVGIQKPFADRNETISVVEASDISVVSSGIYERYFTLDGVSYHHLINPESGYPYENGLISVTILSPKSVDGDGLSTSCFALGLEKGLALIESIPETYAIFITNDDQIHYSKGFSKAIKIVE